MKKLIIILFLLCIGFVSNAQIQKPDTLQLSAKELFGESDDWNDVGILRSYVDFSKDVLSSSNLSIGIIGKQTCIQCDELKNLLDENGIQYNIHVI